VLQRLELVSRLFEPVACMCLERVSRLVRCSFAIVMR